MEEQKSTSEIIVEEDSHQDQKMESSEEKPKVVQEQEREEEKKIEEGQVRQQPKNNKAQQIFKSSSIPQDEELRKYLQGLLTGDNFNKYCVDCQHKQSSFALLAYGTFVCQDCAKEHIRIFKGRSYSIVKDIFNEHWDDYQLESIAPGVAGNRLFFNYLQNYEGLATMPIEKKYNSVQVDWYVKRLTAHLDQKPFNEVPPARDWSESFTRAKESMKSLIKRDKKPALNPDQPLLPNDVPTTSQEPPAQSLQESSQPATDAPSSQQQQPVATPSKWKSKLKGFFKDKFTKSSSGPKEESKQGDAAVQQDQPDSTQQQQK